MIPGHGGIMDRFDCQFLMATFVNVYISSFIRTPSPAKLLTQVKNQYNSNLNLLIFYLTFLDIQLEARTTIKNFQLTAGKSRHS